DASFEKDVVILVGRIVTDKAKDRKVSTSSKVAGKRKQTAKSSGRETTGDPSNPLYEDSDPYIHGNFLTLRAS
ncbi:hypothetical protein Tco_0563045, partial [Tanacetum coccineum]